MNVKNIVSMLCILMITLALIINFIMILPHVYIPNVLHAYMTYKMCNKECYNNYC